MALWVGLRSIFCAAILLAATSGAALANSTAAANAQPAAAFGPEVPLLEPSGGYVGKLDLDVFQGPVGMPVTVTGTGLPAGETFDLVWRTSIGSWKVENAEYLGRDYAPVGYRIAAVTTDAAGGFTASFNIPEDFGFWHDITVQNAERVLNQAAFYVDMTIKLTPESGPAGSPINVEVKGIGRQQLQNSWMLLYDNTYTGWMSSVTTGGSANFTIPAVGSPGTHVIEVLHGDFTFPYRNMQQSPEPDRPRFILDFEVTEGEAILPLPVDQQGLTSVRGLPEPADLTVTPRFAQVGQPVVLAGEGFTPGATYPLNWTTVTGNRVSGSGWEESSSVIGEVTADAAGKIETTIDTPDDLGGTHKLWIDAGGEEKAGLLWITPSSAPLDVGSGPAGTAFTISLKGVGWTETANIYAVVYDNAYIGYACGFNSQGTVEIFLQATGEPGIHYIDLYPAIYKGKETRPNNFRLPQLTYAQDHPGEDLPRFSYAFEVTAPN